MDWEEMRHELRASIKQRKVSLMQWTAYRLDLFIGSIAMALTSIVSIFMFYVVFMYVPTLSGWTFHQVLFIIGFMTLSYGLWELFFGDLSPWNVEESIRMGNFDLVLVKPISTINYFISHIELDGMGDILVGLASIMYASQNIGIVWTLPMLLLVAVMLASSVLIYVSLNILLSTTAFIFTRTTILSDLFFKLNVFTKYPIDIYSPTIVFVLTFVFPLAFVGYYPSEVFIGQGIHRELSYLTPLVAVMLFAISYKIWNYGVSKYTSVGH